MTSVLGSLEPMQQALDGWYREQPAAFIREPEPSADPADPAELAIVFNHLLTYGRLAGERDLIDLRQQGVSRVVPVLLDLTRARHAELMVKAPADLQSALRAGLTSIKERLMQKATAIDVATAMRTRAAAIEQSIQLGEAVLEQDPDQYPQLVADAEGMTSKLGLEADEQQTLFESIRRRYATAARNSRPHPGSPSA